MARGRKGTGPYSYKRRRAYNVGLGHGYKPRSGWHVAADELLLVHARLIDC